MFASQPETTSRQAGVLRRSIAILVVCSAIYVVARLMPPLDLFSAIVVILSILLAAQALFSSYLMLYAWEHPDPDGRDARTTRVSAPELRYSVLLPARHEETVIFETIRKLTAVDYPSG